MIHHVALETRRDLAGDARSFWTALGFAPVDPPAALRSRADWYERSGTQVHVLWKDDPVAPAEGHVAIVAPDYEATLERLRAAGFDPEPRSEHWGAPRCFVRAPGGHRVEITARAPSA